MHQSIPGYPTNVDPRKATTMRDQLTELAAFQTRVRAVRAAPAAERMGRAQELIATEGRPPATYPTALSLLMLLRDSIVTVADWNETPSAIQVGLLHPLPPADATGRLCAQAVRLP
jgi:hypothetical protein